MYLATEWDLQGLQIPSETFRQKLNMVYRSQSSSDLHSINYPRLIPGVSKAHSKSIQNHILFCAPPAGAGLKFMVIVSLIQKIYFFSIEKRIS